MTPEQLKYKEEQQKRMKAFVVGGKDPSGNIITAILSKADEYVIYEIKTKVLSDSLKVQIDTLIEEDKVPIDRFNQIRTNFAKLKGLLYKVNDDSSIKVRIAHIISHALSGKTEEANKQFNDLITEINSEYSKQFNHRLRYLVTNLVCTLALITYALKVYYEKRFIDFLQIRNMVFIVAAGSIGGFISVSRRLRETVFEKDVGSIMYIIYGLERVFISIFGSVIVYFAIKSNFVFGIVNKLEKPLYGFILFAIVAGFSETLIPNLLIKLEKDGNSKNNS